MVVEQSNCRQSTTVISLSRPRTKVLTVRSLTVRGRSVGRSLIDTQSESGITPSERRVACRLQACSLTACNTQTATLWTRHSVTSKVMDWSWKTAVNVFILTNKYCHTKVIQLRHCCRPTRRISRIPYWCFGQTLSNISIEVLFHLEGFIDRERYQLRTQNSNSL
jgi:hypothetical protein